MNERIVSYFIIQIFYKLLQRKVKEQNEKQKKKKEEIIRHDISRETHFLNMIVV